MKNIAAIALTLIASTSLALQAAAPAAAAKAPAFKAHVLTNAEFDQLLQHPEKVLLVDVRRPDELGSIGGFPAYFSVQQADIEKSLQWIPRDRTIVTISNHAARAGKTADLLASRGFKVAGAIGAQTYEEAGGKLVKIAKPAAAAATAP